MGASATDRRFRCRYADVVRHQPFLLLQIKMESFMKLILYAALLLFFAASLQAKVLSKDQLENKVNHADRMKSSGILMMVGGSILLTAGVVALGSVGPQDFANDAVPSPKLAV